jgi:hypothetical protein
MSRRIPRELGEVVWRGGEGKPGMMGGRGFKCSYCSIGDKHTAFPSIKAAEIALATHLSKIHNQEPLVVAFFRL